MDIRASKKHINTVYLDEPVSDDENISRMDVIASDFNIEDNLIEKELIESLIRAVLELKLEDQQLLRYYYHDEMIQEDIAKKMNISQATVARRLQRIIKQLQDTMIKD